MLMAFHFEKCSKTTFAVGLLQFLTSAFIIGWLLSVYWGLLVVVRSFDLPYLGNQPSGGANAGAPGGLEQINDVAKFLASQQPRSDQEQYPAPGYNIGNNPNQMINMGGGAPFGGSRPGGFR